MSVRFASSVSLLIACWTVLLAAPGTVRAQKFSLYAYAFMNGEQQPSIQVNAAVPYRSLVFFKRESVFESTFDLYLKLTDGDGTVVDTAVLKQTVSVPAYGETMSGKKSARVSRQFAVKPGSYSLEAALTVRNTQLRTERTVTLTVPDFLASGIGVASPRLYAVPRPLVSEMGPLAPAGQFPEPELHEVESSTFAGIDKLPALRFEIYSEASESRHLNGILYVEVVDVRKNQLFYHMRPVELRGNGDSYIALLDVDDWDLGGYRMNIRVVMTDPFREAAAFRNFTIGFTRAMLDRHFDDTLEMLAVITPSRELEELENAPVEERPRAWTEFWRRRDPSPGTEANEALEQFLARIEYITENFSRVGPGWRSDRGKVYLRFGPPDEIESTIDSVAQGEYLIWRYYEQNLVFVFYDRYFGVGDYQLISTNAY